MCDGGMAANATVVVLVVGRKAHRDQSKVGKGSLCMLEQLPCPRRLYIVQDPSKYSSSHAQSASGFASETFMCSSTVL